MDRAITNAEAAEIVDGTKKRFYVGGIVFYEDIFKVPHCTRWFASIGGPEFSEFIKRNSKGESLIPPWRTADQFNDVDTDCENY
jgi:hypothetical protein